MKAWPCMCISVLGPFKSAVGPHLKLLMTLFICYSSNISTIFCFLCHVVFRSWWNRKHKNILMSGNKLSSFNWCAPLKTCFVISEMSLSDTLSAWLPVTVCWCLNLAFPWWWGHLCIWRLKCPASRTKVLHCSFSQALISCFTHHKIQVSQDAPVPWLRVVPETKL